MGDGSGDVPCDVLGVCTEGTESTTRELDPTTGVGSLIGSVEPVNRRVLVEFPVGPLVLGGGILGALVRIIVVEVVTTHW
jgi:hypothetical protein